MGLPLRGVSSLDERSQPFASRGVSEFFQRLCFYLANSFPCHVEILADLFERMVRPFSNAEPHPKHLFFPWREGSQDFSGLLGQAHPYDSL